VFILVVLNVVYLLRDFRENWRRLNHAIFTAVNEFLSVLSTFNVGRDRVDGIATRYGLDGPGIESQWGQDFLHTSRPDLGPIQPPIQWIPGLFPVGGGGGGGKSAGACVDHPHQSSAEVKERVDLYLYSPSGPSWPVIGRTLLLPLLYTLNVRFIWISVRQTARNTFGLFSHTKEGRASLMGVDGITFTCVS
jgi:hypothetical protein